MGLCAMSYEERRSSYSFIDSQMNSMDDDDDDDDNDVEDDVPRSKLARILS